MNQEQLWHALRRVMRYTMRLGVLGGVGALLRMHFSGGIQGAQIPLNVPGGRFAVFGRCGTSDLETFEQVFICQQYAFPLPFEPEIIVDAGANVGYSTVYFATRFPGARILAIEPEASNYKMLLRNIKPYANVAAIRAALWSHDGVVTVANPSAEHWAFQMTDAPLSRSAEQIKALSVPTVLAQLGGRIDLLKVDIEGAEKNVFASDHRWMLNIGAIAVELHDQYVPGASRAVNRATSDYPFDEMVSGENVVFTRADWKPSGRA